MSQNEKRMHPRIAVNEEFCLVDGLFDEYVANISRGGIFLHCNATLPEGCKVKLGFTILLDDIETIEGVGRVVRTQVQGEKGLGIEFVSLSGNSREIVEEVCRRQEEMAANATD